MRQAQEKVPLIESVRQAQDSTSDRESVRQAQDTVPLTESVRQAQDTVPLIGSQWDRHKTVPLIGSQWDRHKTVPLIGSQWGEDCLRLVPLPLHHLERVVLKAVRHQLVLQQGPIHDGRWSPGQERACHLYLVHLQHVRIDHAHRKHMHKQNLTWVRVRVLSCSVKMPTVPQSTYGCSVPKLFSVSHRSHKGISNSSSVCQQGVSSSQSP